MIRTLAAVATCPKRDNNWLDVVVMMNSYKNGINIQGSTNIGQHDQLDQYMERRIYNQLITISKQ